jgi:small-conductance mechanosensitive channel
MNAPLNLPFDLAALGPLVNGLIHELTTAQGWWAPAALAVCVALSMRLAARLDRRLAERGRSGRITSWVHRIGWPLIALALTIVARSVLARFVPVSLLTVAIELLVAVVVIRSILLALRQTFPSARWVAGFEQPIAFTVWLLTALDVLDLLPALLHTLETVVIPLGKSRITLLQLITGLLTVALSTLLALWASSALDARLASATAMPSSARAVIGRIAKPMLMLIALLIALPVVGIDLTMLSVFSGALGVGLGFGMQKIAANYISGFIILLDNSIEPGRLIRVDKYRGVVSEIATRYTVLKGLDGVDAIVPNEMLVGSVVESETFTNTRTRIPLQVGVAYDCDVEQAMAILVDIARAQPRVLTDPPPLAFLVDFGDSSITLELGFWVSDPETGTLGLRSAINMEIWRRFRDAGIQIPFPQREVTVKSGTLPGIV